MKIILIQVLLPLATYFIGVLIGRKTMHDKFYHDGAFWIPDDVLLTDPEDIQHAGYSQESMGRDK